MKFLRWLFGRARPSDHGREIQKVRSDWERAKQRSDRLHQDLQAQINDESRRIERLIRERSR